MNDAETKAIQEGCPPEYQWIKDGVCVMSKRGRFAVASSAPEFSRQTQSWVFRCYGYIDLSFCAAYTSVSARLATLEAEREQLRRLLEEARPVVETLQYYTDPPYNLHEVSAMLEHLPALLALIEQIEGLSHE